MLLRAIVYCCCLQRISSAFQNLSAGLFPIASTEAISTNPNDVRFLYFADKLNEDNYVEIIYGNKSSLQRSKLLPGVGLTMFAHGFIVNTTTGGCVPLKHALLLRNYRNVICVDWGKLATPNPDLIPTESPLVFPFYVITIKTAVIAAKRIADFLGFLKANNILENFSTVHLFGHSLGAHVMGTAGREISKKFGEKIAHITGLEPAGPFYQIVRPMYKLSKSKALYVDVVHTDSKVFGSSENLGHVDFFANGGRGKDQPGCPPRLNLFNEKALVCPHDLAVDYYERAILGENLIGCRCKYTRTTVLGSNCPKPVTCGYDQQFGPTAPIGRGTFYLPVPESPPPEIQNDYIKYA